MLTDAQLAQRQAAGRASYRKMFARVLLENTRPDATVCWERLAERLSCIRITWGFQKRTRGLTSRYVQDKAFEMALVDYTMRAYIPGTFGQKVA